MEKPKILNTKRESTHCFKNYQIRWKILICYFVKIQGSCSAQPTKSRAGTTPEYREHLSVEYRFRPNLLLDIWAQANTVCTEKSYLVLTSILKYFYEAEFRTFPEMARFTSDPSEFYIRLRKASSSHLGITEKVVQTHSKIMCIKTKLSFIA